MQRAGTVDQVVAGMMQQLRATTGAHDVHEENLRLSKYPDEASAYLSVYREEDGSEWAQLRIGYLYNPMPPKHLRRLDFKAFLAKYQRRGEPIRVSGAPPVSSDGWFVNEVHDDHHRFGTDIMLNSPAAQQTFIELTNWLMCVAKYPTVRR